MVGGIVGAQAAAMEIWLGECWDIPEYPLPRGKALPHLYSYRGQGSPGREHVAGSAVSSHLPM